MTIYPSDRAVPYVYICTHKETNQFYIGYREKNVKLNTPSHLDLPEYKTSSTIINPDFHDYTWTIVAEFFDPSHAYTFEQQLICDNWENPLLLNGYYRLGDHKQFRRSGPTGVPSPLKGRPSPLKGKPSPKKGIPLSEETKQKISDASKGRPNPKKGIPRSTETKQKISDAKTGKPGTWKGKTHSAETKEKISDSLKQYHLTLDKIGDQK